MSALFALWLLQLPALSVSQVDILLIRVDHEEQLPLVPAGFGDDQARSVNFHTLQALCDGEDFRLAVGNQDRVFIVRRELAIGSYSRPTVLQDTHIVRALMTS